MSELSKDRHQISAFSIPKLSGHSSVDYCQVGSHCSLRHNNVGRMNEVIYTRCCIAGGGPAGVMLGFLLARMGIDVFVLEKHADFLRDFRGDTIHPSTLAIMHELGILDEFLKRPHQEIRSSPVRWDRIPSQL